MNENLLADLSAWLTQAGLAGTPETDIVSVFCERCVAAGVPLARAVIFVDTLHPVHEGRLFRWGYSPVETPLLEYGRTSPDALAASGSNPRDVEIAERWRHSPHYRMLQTGESFWRRRLNGATDDEFSVLPEWRTEGMTDYVAIITRFAAEGVIGEMDGVYSAWATRDPEGFTDDQIAALKRIVPYLGLAIKSVSLARMIGTLMETYLGHDAGQRVLSGRIVRGIAEQIDAVIWFSDLRGFTRITDGRFQGGYTTRHYGRPLEGVHAVQMELACRGYLHEPVGAVDPATWPCAWDEAFAAPMRTLLGRVLTACIAFASGRSA